MSDRARVIAGIRAFADWLEANPDVAPPSRPRFLLSLSTNSAVTDFAAAHDIPVTADHEGNLTASLVFGPVAYDAYGYVDFAAHRAATEERDARAWAEKNNLQITPRTN